MAHAFEVPGQELSTLQKIGRGLSAFGAGVGGRGQEFLANQQVQEDRLDLDRQKALADDLQRARGLLDKKDLIGVRDLANSRIQTIVEIGGNPAETQQLLDITNAAISGDMDSLKRLGSEIDEGLQDAVRAGIIQRPQAKTRPLTPQEIATAGLPAGTSAQVEPNGKITVLSKPEVVKPAKEVETFTPVLDEDGLIIGQQSSITGKVETDPRVAAREKKQLAEQRTEKAAAGEKKIEDAAKIASDNIDQTTATIDRLFDHPGLSGAVGFGLGERLIPGTDAADFDAIVETVKARLGFDELAKMRAASPTGGALGQVTERELAFLQAANQSLSLSQSEDQFLENMRLIQASLRRLQAVQQQARDGGEAPQQQGPQQPAGAGVIRFDATGKRVN